jgi:uncharacterized CHY-type Zn-finger protein
MNHDSIAEKLFGRTISDSHNDKKCVTCGKKITKFKDDLSVKEYDISGMCQKCQDETFD